LWLLPVPIILQVTNIYRKKGDPQYAKAAAWMAPISSGILGPYGVWLALGCDVDRRLISGASPKAANAFGRLATTNLLEMLKTNPTAQERSHVEP
jgi:hypothetical protein